MQGVLIYVMRQGNKRTIMIFSTFERMIAFRYLRARRKEGFISVTAIFSFLGIMLGVATLIVVMAVMNGFRAELMDRILGINAHLSVSMIDSSPIKDFDIHLETIQKVPGIRRAAPVVLGQVLATAGEHHTGAMVRGIRYEDIKNKPVLSDAVVRGRLWNKDDDYERANSVIIGVGMARMMNLRVGDTITLLSPNSTNTLFGQMPRVKDYEIVGIFDVGMIEYDSATIFMPLSAAQTYFRYRDSITSFEVDAVDQSQIPHIADRILSSAKLPFRLTDWQQANSQFLQSLKVERTVMFLILSLIIMIAAFNIISGLVMLVTGKKKEIAVLRAMGATRHTIMRIFFLCGAAIGVCGTAFGVLLGVGFALNIQTIRAWIESSFGVELFPAGVYFLSQLPVDLRNDDVLNVVILSLGLSLLAPLFPSWKASRTEPAEGLRYE